jgi:plasmid stabilization system protein ParE
MSRPPASIKVLPRAIHEIAEQAAYYRKEATPEIAERWRTAVNDAIRSLRIFPVRGPLVNPANVASRSIRKLHISGFPAHLIFYRYEAETNIVFIVRVLHGARDVDPLLG